MTNSYSHLASPPRYIRKRPAYIFPLYIFVRIYENFCISPQLVIKYSLIIRYNQGRRKVYFRIRVLEWKEYIDT